MHENKHKSWENGRAGGGKMRSEIKPQDVHVEKFPPSSKPKGAAMPKIRMGALRSDSQVVFLSRRIFDSRLAKEEKSLLMAFSPSCIVQVELKLGRTQSCSTFCQGEYLHSVRIHSGQRDSEMNYWPVMPRELSRSHVECLIPPIEICNSGSFGAGSTFCVDFNRFSRSFKMRLLAFPALTNAIFQILSRKIRCHFPVFCAETAVSISRRPWLLQNHALISRAMFITTGIILPFKSSH